MTRQTYGARDERRLVRDLDDLLGAADDLRRLKDAGLLDLVLAWGRQSDPNDRPGYYDPMTDRLHRDSVHVALVALRKAADAAEHLRAAVGALGAIRTDPARAHQLDAFLGDLPVCKHCGAPIHAGERTMGKNEHRRCYDAARRGRGRG